MKVTIKKLLLQAEDGYRDSDTDYRLYVGCKDTKSSRNALEKRLFKSGFEYKLADYGAYIYVTLDEVAEYGLVEDDLDYCEDLRGYHRQQERERLEREKSELESSARLLGYYEATLSAHISHPTTLHQVAKLLVHAAKRVL